MNIRQLASLTLTLSIVLTLTSCRELAEAFKEGYYGTAYKKKGTQASSSSSSSHISLTASPSSTSQVEAQMIAEAQRYLQTGSIQPWRTPEQGVHQVRVIALAFYLANNYGISTGDRNGTAVILQNLQKVLHTWYAQFYPTGMAQQFLAEERRTKDSEENQIALNAIHGYQALLINNVYSDFWTSPGYEWAAKDIVNYLTNFRSWIVGRDTYSDAFMKRMDEVNKQYERSLMNSIPNY